MRASPDKHKKAGMLSLTLQRYEASPSFNPHHTPDQEALPEP